MSREVRRVPLDFDWPLNKVWDGYLMPEKFREDKCPDCDNGYAPAAKHMYDQWYGYIPFDPASTGSRPFTAEDPAVRAFAERNVAHAPDFYGSGEAAIVREANRLLGHWNGMWMHHLSPADVAALLEAERLHDFTHTWNPETRWTPIDPPVTPSPAEVNAWSLGGLGHDSSNASVVIRARCQREGLGDICPTCDGHASLEAYDGQRVEAEAYVNPEPPEGVGYQLWETVSEGSPITPVFASPEELARYMVGHCWGTQSNAMASSFDVAMKFIDVGWAPSSGTIGGEVLDGVEWAARA